MHVLSRKAGTAKYQFSRWEKLLLKTAPPAAAFLIRGWCRSCRVVKRINAEHEILSAAENGGCVYATWHQRMFYFFEDFGSRHVTMMISQSKDGEYANALANKMGFYSVRGSRSRDGKKAMHELIDLMKKGGYTAGMMADGPTGPPRVLKMGTIRIARETGKPIIPMMYGARHKIILKSWDKYIIPIPCTRIVIYHGDPVFVPRDAGDEECEQIRKQVEQTMNEMADFCDAFWRGSPVGKPGYDLPEGTSHT